jgi:phosphatidylinositol-3-phosphatase
MENHRAPNVIGSPDAPFTTTLAAECATARRYSSVGAPSLPNYLGATSGTTSGIGDDAPPSAHPLTTDNLFRQVRASGRTERSYEESMTVNCEPDSAGQYAVKHNPAPYYVGADDRVACGRDDVPLGTFTAGALRTDLATGSLPTFSFVTPNLCSDTHDCPVSVGDRFLAAWMPAIVASALYRQGSTVVFVVWDEPTPMPFVAVSPAIPPGSVVTTPVDHYSLLRTTEELLGLPLLGQAADATSLRGALRLGAP